MDSDDKKIFIRRYAVRISKTVTGWTTNKWYALYTEKGEAAFLDKLEDEENFADFCGKYYDILREAFNIDSCGMYDYYDMFKVKFGGDYDSFEHELRQNKRLAKIMGCYI
jgi:beta-galactosidase GanA